MKTGNLFAMGYTERDFDELVYASKRYHYEEGAYNFYFTCDKDLVTEVKLVFKVVPGSHSYSAESDLDYYGYNELVAWDIGATIDLDSGNEVDPEDVLSHDDYEHYKQKIDNFISGYA